MPPRMDEMAVGDERLELTFERRAVLARDS